MNLKKKYGKNITIQSSRQSSQDQIGREKPESDFTKPLTVVNKMRQSVAHRQLVGVVKEKGEKMRESKYEMMVEDMKESLVVMETWHRENVSQLVELRRAGESRKRESYLTTLREEAFH